MAGTPLNGLHMVGCSYVQHKSFIGGLQMPSLTSYGHMLASKGGGNGLTVEIQAEFSVQQLRFVFQIDTQDTQADWLAGSSDL